MTRKCIKSYQVFLDGLIKLVKDNRIDRLMSSGIEFVRDEDSITIIIPLDNDE